MDNYLHINNSDRRNIIIGDIHGCYDEMLELLEKVDFNEKDILISVGDMVDRGPKSWEVAKFFINKANAFSVLGNHERRIAGVIQNTSQPAWSQLHSLTKLSKPEHKVFADLFGSLPAVIETEYVIVTHARLDPQKSITAQDPYHTCAVGGESVQIELNSEGIPLWFKEFINKNQNNKPICIGHIAYNKVELVENRLYALDTEAVHGGELTAVVFPGNEIVSVKVKYNHYSQSLKEWGDHLLSFTNVCTIKLNKISYMIKKNNPNDIEQNIISSFYEEFRSRAFIERTEILKKIIPKLIGDIPDQGNERGEYFIKLNTKIIDPDKRIYIKKILSAKKIELEMFLSLFPTLSINNIETLINEIESSI